MAEMSISPIPSLKNDTRTATPNVNSGADKSVMDSAMNRVKQNSASMARTTAGRMMPGGNTMISVNSMKGEALCGRTANVASKKAFKSNRYARSAE